MSWRTYASQVALIDILAAGPDYISYVHALACLAP